METTMPTRAGGMTQGNAGSASVTASTGADTILAACARMLKVTIRSWEPPQGPRKI